MKYALVNCKILNGKKDMTVIEGQSVLVNDGIIEGIVEKDVVPEDYVKIDSKNGYLTPGLINMHVHLAGNGKPQNTHTYKRKQTAQ